MSSTARMALDIAARRRRRVSSQRATRRQLFMRLCRSLNEHSGPASYCQINRNVPILRLYFGGGDLKPDLRLSRQTITALIAALRSDSDHGWQRDIEVLVFVYWLAHATTYPVVSKAFDIPRSTIHDIVHRICTAIVAILRRVVTYPQDLEVVGAGFAALAGSPAFNVAVGAIDGCHIRIKPPAADGACYFNRKLFHSVQMQAICDDKGRFIDVFVGYTGSVHDARVLKNSPVYTEALYPPAGRCILGDGGYPCLSSPICIMTPYREPVRDPVHANYNRKHSRARNVIERAFGMMKTRWRSVFFKALEVSPTFVPLVVTSCAILHNLCIANGDIVEPEDDEGLDGDADAADDGPAERETRHGNDARNILAAAAFARPGVPVPHGHDYL